MVRSRSESVTDPNCRLDYVYVGMMTWGGSDPAIAGQERSIKQFCQCDVDGVIGSEGRAELPNTRNQEIMRISI